jgi:hypothetical protein
LIKYAEKGYDAVEMTKELGQRFPIMETCMKLYSAGRLIPEHEESQILDLKKRVRSIPDPVLEERKKTMKAHSAEVDVEKLETRGGVKRT